MEEKVFEMVLNAAYDTDDYDKMMNGIADALDLTNEEFEKYYDMFFDGWKELKTYAANH